MEPVKPGSSFDVILGHRVSNPRGDLKVLVNDKAAAVPDSAAVVSDNPLRVTVKLAAPLSKGDRLSVMQGGGEASNIITVSAADAPPQPPSNILQVTEGDSTVSGVGATGLDKVHVELVEGDQLIAAKDAMVDASGAFTTTFDKTKFNADERLLVSGVKGATQGDSVSLPVNPVDFDFGRMRAYFTLGALLSKSSGNFDSWDPFLSLNMDKGWMLGRTSIQRSKKPTLDLHTFFDARLTAIPVANPSTAPRTASSATLDTLVTSQKAGSLTTGVYAPITLTRWHFAEKDYSFFVAPLGKIGFVTPTTTSTNGLDSNRFFVNYGFGARLGHNREYSSWDGARDRNRSPEPMTYVDFVVGRFGNFENILGLPRLDATGAQLYLLDSAGKPVLDTAGNKTALMNYLRYRPWRLGVEGMFKLPHSPFLLGFSANVGLQRIQQPYGPQHLSGYSDIGDDLRFLFGARFDVRKLLNKIGELGSN